MTDSSHVFMNPRVHWYAGFCSGYRALSEDAAIPGSDKCLYSARISKRLYDHCSTNQEQGITTTCKAACVYAVKSLIYLSISIELQYPAPQKALVGCDVCEMTLNVRTSIALLLHPEEACQPRFCQGLRITDLQNMISR
jgi:hypothetical protein